MHDQWQTPRGPSLALAAEKLAPICADGDAASCLVVAWQADGAGTASATRSELARLGQRLSTHCAAGIGGACHALADALLDGRGFAADHEAALTVWREACERGHGPSCTTLARRAQGRDTQVAGTVIDYAQRGCAAGDPAGCALKGTLTGGSWERDQAVAFWSQQCLAGHADSCVTLVDRISEAGWVSPPGELERLLYTGCVIGSGSACARLADFRRQEVGDIESAGELYARACERLQSGQE